MAEAIRLYKEWLTTDLDIPGWKKPTMEMIKALRELDARLQLKCFTAIEILHLSWLARKTVRETLTELKEAGLDALTGGGAEIFRKEVRSAIAVGKESAEEYLDVPASFVQFGDIVGTASKIVC